MPQDVVVVKIHLEHSMFWRKGLWEREGMTPPHERTQLRIEFRTG